MNKNLHSIFFLFSHKCHLLHKITCSCLNYSHLLQTSKSTFSHKCLSQPGTCCIANLNLFHIIPTTLFRPVTCSIQPYTSVPTLHLFHTYNLTHLLQPVTFSSEHVPTSHLSHKTTHICSNQTRVYFFHTTKRTSSIQTYTPDPTSHLFHSPVPTNQSLVPYNHTHLFQPVTCSIHRYQPIICSIQPHTPVPTSH